MNCLKPYIVCATFLLCHSLFAQNTPPYEYQDLSHLYYENLKDSLKKAWACPSIYKEKSTQKKYAEIWKERTDFLLEAIDDDHFVCDRTLYRYVGEVVTQIFNSNRSRMERAPLLLIDRSAAVNAYALGGDIIVVNLGLISFSNTREELALAIAHEISHNLLQHPETAISKRAEWLSSDEYKKSLNAVLDSKYERLSRLKKLTETYSFNRNRHQRYHEKEADSLAIDLLKAANIAFKADFFLRLDSSDNHYREELKHPVETYFNTYQVKINSAWLQKRGRGLSTRTYNFRDTTVIADSLKTHPDCEERYLATRELTDAGKSLSPISQEVRQLANKMIIWNLFNSMSLTPCLYRIMQEKDQNNQDPWYDFMINNIFLGLLYADKTLHRFNAIGIMPKEYISRNYYELQTMLEQIPRNNLQQSCEAFRQADFWKEMPAQERSLKTFINYVAFSEDQEKEERTQARQFLTNNPTSMYCEFVNIFDKK